MKFIKVLAEGTYKRYAWLEFDDGEVMCLRVPDKLYWKLRSLGVKTSQKLRYEKDK